MRERISLRELSICCALALVWLVPFAVQRQGSLAGDPHAVYFPIAQNLLAGEGWASFSPLWIGAGRQPGYPVLLALVGTFVDDLFVAGEIVGIVSALITVACIYLVLRFDDLPSLVWFPTIVLTICGYTFVRASLESLPDMPFVASFAACSAILIWRVRGNAGQRTIACFAAGLVAGGAALIRPNGALLVFGGPLAIVLTSSERRIRDALAFGVGFTLIFGGVMYGVRAGLAAHGLDYPRANMRSVMFIPKPGQSELEAFLLPILDGLKDLPYRLTRSVGAACAILGVLTLVVTAVVRRSTSSIVIVCLSGAVISILVPLHFEHRYLLFLAPSLFAGAVVAAWWLPAALRGPWWTSAVSVGVLAVGVVVYLVDKTLSDAAEESAVAVGVAQTCGTLLDRGATLVGIDPSLYSYSNFHACPRPAVGRPPLMLVPAHPRAEGIDLWMGEGVSKDRVVSRFGGLGVASVDTSTLTVASETNLLDVPMVVRTPGEKDALCRTKSFSVPPAPYVAAFEFVSDPGVAGYAEVTGTARTHAVFGDTRTVVVPLTVTGTLSVRLCPADSIRAPGQSSLRRLRLSPR